MARKGGHRRLSAEEAELWRKVVENAAPLHPQRSEKPAEPSVAASETAPVPRAPIAPFGLSGGAGWNPTGADLAPSLSCRIARQPVSMDHKMFTRMRRGKLQVEGRIDLHGMTLAQAHPTLINFVMGAQATGKRLLLVITGKGQKRQSDEWHRTHGALKRQVPMWLRMPPLAGAVLQISEAHQSHGGTGAYYVYLRRLR